MKQVPWILGGAIIFGTAFATLSSTVSFPSIIFLGLGVTILFLFSLPRISQPLILTGFILFLITFWFAQSRFQVYEDLTALPDHTASYRVIGYPEDKGFYQQIILRPSECSVVFCKNKEVLWQASLTTHVEPGEKIQFHCDLILPENFSLDFDYRKYLAKEGVGYICEEEYSFQSLPWDFRGKVQEAFLLPKSIFENSISRHLPDPEAGLAKGLLLGGDDYLSNTVQERFTTLGLTHIVAVSGYNIVIIVNALLAAALFVGLWRRGATITAFIGIILFILLIGSPASAMRAGIMALAAFGGFLIGRVSYSLQALYLTAALMLLWNPFSLWYDAGFQLSFLATLAVIVAMRGVEDKLSQKTFVRALQEIVWLSVWVNLFLLPLLLYQFKNFTVLSIPANILFLPVVPIAMLASFVVAIVGIIFPVLTVLVSWIAYLPLAYIIKGVSLLSALPETTVPVSLPLFFVIIWYLALFLILVEREEELRKKRYEKNFTCPHRH